MSFQEIEKLSKADLKNKLSQMGMSLDRIDHPRDYYVQLYLEKSNAKNKVTRGNTPFYKNKILRGKRERENERIRETDKELIDDPNYEEEEFEEEEEIFDKDDEDLIYEESEEKEDKNLSKRKIKKVKIDEKTNDYKESGIKITRLIRKKKEKIPQVNKDLVKNENQKNNVRRRILNNYKEMAGENDDYEKNNTENYLIGENTQNQNIDFAQDYNSKNNEFYNLKNNNNLNEKNNDVITLKVERMDNYGEDINNSNANNISQNLRKQIKKEYNKTYLLGKPNEPTQYKEKEIKSSNNNISFGAPKESIQTNIHNILKGPISFGVNQSSVFSTNGTGNEDVKNNLTKKNANEPKQYDYFISNISESIKEDAKDNQNSFKPKKVLIKWDTPKQKEFLFSSMAKEQTFKRPSDEEMNKLNKVNLQTKFETQDIEDNKINQPRNQIVSDSIQNTTINKNVIGDSNYNMNDNDNINYKAKLRSYKPKNENELNNSNSINANKEIILKKVEKDINNINEIEYNDMNNLNEIKYSNMNKNDKNKDNQAFNNNNILENNENMNINRDENMNNYIKSNNNYVNFRNENNNMNNDIKWSNNQNKYNNIEDNTYSNENNNTNNYLKSCNNQNNYNYIDDKNVNKNIGQSNLGDYNLLNDNENNNINYKQKDIEMKDNNNMKYFSNDDNNNINYKEKAIEMKDNNNMKYIYNDGNNNNINDKDIEMIDDNNIKYLSNNANKNNINEKVIDMEDNNNKYFTNEGNNNYNSNMDNNANINNLQKESLNYYNPYNKSVNDIISYNNENKNLNNIIYPNNMTVNEMNKYNNENVNIDNGNINEDMNHNQMINQTKIYVNDNNELNNKYQESGQDFEVSKNKKSNKKKFVSNLKNSILNKFKNNVYLWPLILLIVFGLCYFLNTKFENFSNSSLLIIFSIIMGLIVLYNLFKYIGHMKNYKKMAKEDRDKLIEYLKNQNITREEFGNNLILINKFIISRIQYHNIKAKEYKDYVFPYLYKYLKKDNLCLKIEERNSGVNNVSFWKDI